MALWLRVCMYHSCRGLGFISKHLHSQPSTLQFQGSWTPSSGLRAPVHTLSNISTYTLKTKRPLSRCQDESLVKYHFWTHTFTESAISCTPLAAASFMIGVIKPLSVATATEMSTEGSCFGPSPSQLTLTPGICCK